MKRFFKHFGLIVLILIGAQTCAHAGQIYWATAAGEIQRANADGTNVETLVDNSGGWAIGLDAANGKMYWSGATPVGGQRGILRANLDGTEFEELISGLKHSNGIALDLLNQQVYWSETGEDHIRRANLDGTAMEEVVSPGYLWSPRDLALDINGGKVYWTGATGSGDAVRRANLDGSQVEDLVTGLAWPQGIALDFATGKMYWADSWPGFSKIQRANLDGTEVEDILVDLTSPQGIALDQNGHKIYWADQDTGSIWRANLDGTESEAIISGLTSPQGIAFIPEPGSLALLGTGFAGVLGYFLLRRKRTLPRRG